MSSKERVWQRKRWREAYKQIEKHGLVSPQWHSQLRTSSRRQSPTQPSGSSSGPSPSMPIAVEQRLTKVGSSVVEMFELPLYCSMRRNCYRTLTVLETILELVKRHDSNGNPHCPRRTNWWVHSWGTSQTISSFSLPNWPQLQIDRSKSRGQRELTRAVDIKKIA